MSGQQVREVGDAEFVERVDTATEPVVVEFFAPWCGNCRRLAPVLERLAADHATRAQFVKINVDENPRTVGTYGISSTPTLLVFVQGQPVAGPLVGAQPEPAVRSWLDDALARPANAGSDDGERSWVAADACALPTAEQPLRVAEFGRLFSTSLRGVRRVSPTRLELEIDRSAEAAARDLAARETDCCGFFSFTFASAGRATTRMEIEVPASRQQVLDGLATQASTAMAA